MSYANDGRLRHASAFAREILAQAANSGWRTKLGLVPGTDVASLAAGVVPLAQIPTITDAKLAESYIKADGTRAFGADQSMGGFKLTNLATPAASGDAASKSYVDAVASGARDFKDSCRVTTTANITLSGTQTIDGVSAIAGDRVLVKNQSTGADNGIYVCAAGAWARAADADTDAEVTAGMMVPVTEGTAGADTVWLLATNDPITLGSTSLSFTQFGGGGSTINTGAGGALAYYPSTGTTLDDVPGSAVDARGGLTLAPTAATSGSPNQFVITGAAHTTLTASTEATDVDFNLARTVQFSTGALTLQRAVRFRAPTIAFSGASTLSDGYNVSIDDEPQAGTNATITRPWALGVNGRTEMKYRAANSTSGNFLLALDNPSGGTQVALGFKINGTATGALRVDSTGNLVLSASGNNKVVYIGAQDIASSADNVHLGGTVAGGPGIYVNSSRQVMIRDGATSANNCMLAISSGTTTRDMIRFNSPASYTGKYWIAANNSDTELAVLTAAINLKLGATTSRGTTEGTNQLVIFNGTAPAGTLTNGVSLYSDTGELKVMDAAGNATLLSPHDDASLWVFDSLNTVTGRHLRIDVEKLLRFLNDKFSLECVHDSEATEDKPGKGKWN